MCLFLERSPTREGREPARVRVFGAGLAGPTPAIAAILSLLAAILVDWGGARVHPSTPI
jgi:hypothetical protein